MPAPRCCAASQAGGTVKVSRCLASRAGKEELVGIIGLLVVIILVILLLRLI